MPSMTKTSNVTDVAQLSVNDDRLDLNVYIDALAEFIGKAATPMTIALQGEWGSGKTSLMNMIKERLCGKEDKEFHGVFINTWHYALLVGKEDAKNEILGGILEQVKNLLGKNGLDKAVEAINKIFTIGGVIVGNAAGRVAGVGPTAGKDAVTELRRGMAEPTAVELKNKLATTIQKDLLPKTKKNGVIFFIDDLDRIDPTTAVQILELLKNIFDIENCIFILAIDYDVVVKGLKSKFGEMHTGNEREFRSFFDKIIQLPFTMPVSNYKMDKLLKESLSCIGYLSEDDLKDKELLESFEKLLALSVENNPRSTKRLINTLSLNSILHNKSHAVEGGDAEKLKRRKILNFALVCIQISYPKIYAFLQRKPDFVNWSEDDLASVGYRKTGQAQVDVAQAADGDWKTALKRLCENDEYLTSRLPRMTRLLEQINGLFKDSDEEMLLEEINGAIKFSAATNVVSSVLATPQADFNAHDYMYSIRNNLTPELKKKAGDLFSEITETSQRIRGGSSGTLAFRFDLPDGASSRWMELWLEFSQEISSFAIRLVFPLIDIYNEEVDKSESDSNCIKEFVSRGREQDYRAYISSVDSLLHESSTSHKHELWYGTYYSSNICLKCRETFQFKHRSPEDAVSEESLDTLAAFILQYFHAQRKFENAICEKP